MQKGFTLVELAIALMVIGLLIGGVLKGQELIENARVTAFVRQFQAYDTAIMIFRNTYGALPGDIKKPNRIPNCTEDVCNIGGNGNGRIAHTADLNPEACNFFPHMVKAGMIKGPEGGDSGQCDIAQSGDYDADEHALFWPELSMGRISNYEGSTLYVHIKFAKIDAKIDDGYPDKGNVRSEDCALIDVDGKYEYDFAVANDECAGWIGFESMTWKWFN